MKELNRDNFKKFVGENKVCVVDFWSSTCMPCRILAPIFEEAADEMDGKAEFAKFNIDDWQELAVEHGIEYVPTLIVFNSGKEVDRIVGMADKVKIIAMVEKQL